MGQIEFTNTAYSACFILLPTQKKNFRTVWTLFHHLFFCNERLEKFKNGIIKTNNIIQLGFLYSILLKGGFGVGF